MNDAGTAKRSVFISYSSSDKPAADEICKSLEGAGHTCWIAPRDIAPGADYPTAIIEGLEGARAVVVIISGTAVSSPHILSEIGHAFDDKKPIIPFRLSSTELPPNFDYFLSMSQWLEAPDGCTAQNLAQLRDAVTKALAGGAWIPKDKEEIGKKGIDRRILAGGAILAILAGGTALYTWWPRPHAPIGNTQPPTGHSQPPAVNPKTPDPKSPPAADPKDNPTDSKPQPWVNPKDGLTYVWVPPGTLTMGCSPGDTECKPDESPSHMVELPAGFWLGQTEVTHAAYRRVVPAAHFDAKNAKMPVLRISWKEAKSYCAAIGGRLPTEAEWEYAARGGTTGPTYGVLSRVAWYAGNSGGHPHEVAGKLPNRYGLYDMLGNASEWVLDRYYNRYDPEAPAIGKVEQPLAANATALARGGFWESEAENVRVSRRAQMDRDDPAPMAGIRCVANRK